MTQKSRADVRLVKCPRCAKILPEPEQVSVYACGGCDTVLQAKYYRKDNNTTGSSLHQDDGVQSNGIIQTLSGGESDGSSQRSSSAGRQSLDQNEERDQNPVVNYNSKHIETANAAYHTSLSDESSLLGNEENGETDDNTDQFNQRDCVVDSNKGHPGAVSLANKAALTESLIVEGCTQEQMGDLDSSEETSMLKEYQNLENTKLEQFDIVNGAKKDQDDQLEQFDGTAFGKHKHVGEASSSGEASMLDESQGIQNKERFKSAPENKLLRVNTKRKEGDGFGECLSKKLDGMKLDEAPSPTEITQVGDENSTVTLEICQSDGVSASSSAKDLVIIGELMSTNASQSPPCESSSLNDVMETSRKKIDFDNSTMQGGSSNALNTVGNLLKVGPRSLNKGSSASEESISSFDGNYDQVSRQEEHVSEETLLLNNAVSGYDDIQEIPELNNDPLGRRANESEGKSSSMLLDEKLNRGRIEDEESLEENQLPFRNSTVPNRHGFPPRISPSYWSSAVAYETGSSSSYVNDELPSDDMRHHPYRHENPETWVRNTRASRATTNTRRRRRFSEESWRENEFLAIYYGYETSGEIDRRAGYHDGYLDQRRRSESWSQSGSLPRMPYSGEVLNGRYHTRNPYIHRHNYMDNLRWSAQLPPTGVYCHQWLCVPPSREISWDLYESYPTNPWQLRAPEPHPWSRGLVIFPDDQRNKDQIVRRLYLREKRQAVKRHLQPVAGGAPFITCNFCMRVLHLPVDFLLTQRRRKGSHMLKCGACLKILEFSLENGCSFVAHMPNACEEADTDVRNGDCVSDKAKVRDADSTDMHSDDSFGGSGKDKTKPASVYEVKTAESDNAARGSAVQGRQLKVTWQLPAQTKSPLHQLMGYSSPHDLLNGHVEDVEK